MPASASSNSTADRCAVPTRWVSAHLYYHDALDDLLRRAVRPLVGELAAGGLIDGFFFIRYWQGGPHVRLRVLPRDQAQAQPVERLIEARIGRFFTRYPSRAVVCSEDYLRTAGWLSQHEFGPGSTTVDPAADPAVVEPLQPNNTLRYVAYVPEEDRLGGPVGVAAFEPHFMDSATLALELIAANPSEQRRTGRALAMMLLAAAVVLPDLARLARYFRYSYRGWAARHAAGDRTRSARSEAGWQQSYDRQRAQLDDLARRLLDQARPGAGYHLDPVSARWVASVSSLRDRLTEARLALAPLLFQCLHKHNNRLGIKVAEETYLLFLLQRTLTEIAGGKDPR
ncbi:MAG TPA: thiopeptide-type bacteriocin biosynthesis protein [Pseudonocardiaceae bacterium]|nr:thiopeptide-type bacteriocin biosynthesis protein [Pseudonocardiaceae bacterium]